MYNVGGERANVDGRGGGAATAEGIAPTEAAARALLRRRPPRFKPAHRLPCAPLRLLAAGLLLLGRRRAVCRGVFPNHADACSARGARKAGVVGSIVLLHDMHLDGRVGARMSRVAEQVPAPRDATAAQGRPLQVAHVMMRKKKSGRAIEPCGVCGLRCTVYSRQLEY